MRPRSYEDLTGKTFNRLTVIRPVTVNKKTKWECRCSCGNVKAVDGLALISGHTKSCGCLHKDVMAEKAKKAKTHGYTHHRLYACYYRMRRRCENKANKSYKWYGGRGIKVCDEWKNDIMSFINWSIENGYKEGLSIDRIDNDGDYSPENCRWADATQQSNNRSTNAFVTYNGETHTYAEWSRIVGIKQLTLRNRIVDGKWSIEKALFTPVHDPKKGGFEEKKRKTIAYKDGEYVGTFESQKEAARVCKLNEKSVSDCVNGRKESVKGYSFKLCEKGE